ncbi:uncharacterized protein LOC126572597 [Anopheles aquasalis]|uniref:uncharacterized protein LOC126572597 n=1 Tax=Anopheles aquasalis TaxID=42839 RepID=UPI00215AD258|nr:uncharacterized protein LOC126572597 [Anopheles aquasalis]
MANNKELLESIGAMLAKAITSASSHARTEQENREPPVLKFSMPEFNSQKEEAVADYFERMEWALELSRIPKEQHGQYARVYMGGELNTALKFLITPRDPEELQFYEIKNSLVAHFDRATNKYAESIKFRTITQQKEETIAQFALRLKRGAAYCEYGKFLDRMLIEQLLHGLEKRDMCDVIIQKKPNTFQQAYEIANTLEATRTTTKEVCGETPTPTQEYENTNKLNYENQTTKRTRKFAERVHTHTRDTANENPNARGSTYTNEPSACYGCGGKHYRSDCRFRNTTCNRCGKTGHIAKVCRSRDKANSQPRTRDNPSDEIDYIHTVRNIPSSGAKQLNVQIDGKTISMELDTGAPCSIIGEHQLRNFKRQFILLPPDRKFTSYTGHSIQCLGRLTVDASLDPHETSHRLNLYVVAGSAEPLFGREWITKFHQQIKWNELFAAQTQCML